MSVFLVGHVDPSPLWYFLELSDFLRKKQNSASSVMLRRVEHVLGDGDALRRWLDAALLENTYDVQFHVGG
jgi:hypothetical protein